MKKLAIAATALLLSLGANAQDQAGGISAATIGGVAVPVVVTGAVAVGVAAAIVSNSGGVSLPPVTTTPVETCNAGDGAPVNGVCTGTTTATVTGTTAITTITFTYPAIVQ